MDQGTKNTNTRNATEILGKKTHVSSSKLHMYLLICAKKTMKINQKCIRLSKRVGEKRMERKGVENEVERIGK